MSKILLIIAGIVIFIIIVVVVRQGGFDLFGEPDPTLNIDVKDITPATWTPGPDGLEAVNIDGDEAVENLLFYTYDNGLWGGIIYDGQNRPRGDTDVTAPNQAPAYLVPYRLEPDYISGKPSDYLGNDSVTWQQIYVRSDGDPAAPDSVSRDRIQVRGSYGGRTTRFSAFWWLEKPRGYGGATASTPGWFSLARTSPSDWAAWDNKTPITILWSWEPQTDRSNLCRRVPFILAGGEQIAPPGTFVRNDAAADLGFCNGQVPADPAFPEAQVMGWLLEPNAGRLSSAAVSVPEFSGVQVKRITSPTDLSNQIDGRIVASGEVDFLANNTPQTMAWTAEMLPPADIQDQVHWKILSLVPR